MMGLHPLCVLGSLSVYRRSYVSQPALEPAELTTQQPQPQPLFLRRNLPAPARPGSADDVLLAALRSVHILNGLECKISCSTSKVSYVLDTEDVLCRLLAQRRGEVDEPKLARGDRFSRWLDEQTQRNKQEQEAILALQGAIAMAQ